MSTLTLHCGFVPLVDCAPLVIANELGFAEEEGLNLDLAKQPSWSAVRDKLALGGLTAVHMLSPVPVAMSMGMWGIPARLDALSVLSVNGTTIGLSLELARKLQESGVDGDLMAAREVGTALLELAPRPLRAGVPFPYSMHAELLTYWLEKLGAEGPQDLVTRTIPPPLMADAVAAGEIDMFCVGEPWGSIAVEAGVAELVLAGCAIWRFSPEKVLAVRHEWAETEPETAAKLMRAVWRAGRWLSKSENRMTASEILAKRNYVDVPAEIIERALNGRLVVSASGEERTAARFIEFFEGAATFPWRSQAVWIAERIATRTGFNRAQAADVARACFRPDLYRQVLGPIGAALPAASEKVEGTLGEDAIVPSTDGEMSLGSNTFFDGGQFDPQF